MSSGSSPSLAPPLLLTQSLPFPFETKPKPKLHGHLFFMAPLSPLSLAMEEERLLVCLFCFVLFCFFIFFIFFYFFYFNGGGRARNWVLWWWWKRKWLGCESRWRWQFLVGLAMVQLVGSGVYAWWLWYGWWMVRFLGGKFVVVVVWVVGFWWL